MTLREYVEQLATLQEQHGQPDNLHSILRDRGVEFDWSPLPDGEEIGRAKQCYGNAGARVLLGGNGFDPDESLTYYEGLVLTGDGLPLPIEHAWAADKNGRVLELTLAHNDDRCRFCLGEGEIHPTDHWAYNPPDEDEDEWIDEEETLPCEFCEGTGKTTARSLEGTTYIGIPVPTEVLREAVVETGVWGVLNNASSTLIEKVLG